MSKYIIRECEQADCDFFFDGDMYSKESGDYNNTLFALTSRYYSGYYSGLNGDDFKALTSDIDAVIDAVGDLYWEYSSYKNIKEIMTDYNLPYSPRSAHAIRLLGDYDRLTQITTYLSIKTGHKWTSRTARGYCQGDYAEMVYCEDNYSANDIDIISDVYMGCCKEFCTIELDDDGNEIDSCYGYFVADCQATYPEDYIKLVSEWACIEDSDITLELIDHIETITRPIYSEFKGVA